MAAKLARATRIRSSSFTLYRTLPSFLSPSSPPLRSFSANTNSFNANPVALQMINYAFSVARSQKSDESYSQGLLVLEHCHSTQQDDNSKGLVLLAMSTLFSERGKFEEAIEKLQRILDLTVSSMAVRVAATEALVGLHLELAQDDTSSVLTDICLQLLETIKLEIGAGFGFNVLDARVKALKGLVELVRGNIESAESFFQGGQGGEASVGNAILSYGEFLHATRNFSKAKELYQMVIEGMSENRDFSHPYNLAACNMALEEVVLAATCALGQVEAHMGNFGDAEEILTTALKRVEEHFGSHHSKVGVILTCIALMFRHKAAMEHSSSLLIQEGLYRKAIDLLKAPPMEIEGTRNSIATLLTSMPNEVEVLLFYFTGAEVKIHRREIAALARGGYGEILSIQQNRKTEGQRMKSWAETVWSNRRLSLAEALGISEASSKVPVIDSRISRVL